MPTQVSRRAFMKGATAVGAAGIVASCANSPESGGSNNITPTTPPPPTVQSGSFAHEPDQHRITINLGSTPGIGGCSDLGQQTFKIRALYDNMMYWAVEVGGKLYLQQWVRDTSVPVSSPLPTVEGAWTNNLGFRLVLSGGATSGTSGVSFNGPTSGINCSNYGYLGHDSLPNNIFSEGVAAGDPSHDGLILWTRAAKDGGFVVVELEIATDPEFTLPVAVPSPFDSFSTSGGTVGTDDDDATHGDHIVKHDLRGLGILSPNTTYFYRFTTPNETDSAGNPFVSFIGRAKTLQADGVSLAQSKIALASCSSFPHGFFNAYRQIARHDDLDGVMHMGDYIYEYPGADGEEANGNTHDYPETGGVRRYDPDNQVEMVTLQQYRRRFRDYRRDIDLQLIHTRYWFINVWDDHETSNDSYDDDEQGPNGGAENHADIVTTNYPIEGATPWEDRKANAAQSYNEWLPINDIRDNMHGYNKPELHRTFRNGDLAELVMLDTRVAGRVEAPVDPSTGATYDESRPMMSAEQNTFMQTSLSNAQADGVKWKLLGQQVMMGHLVGPPLLGGPANPLNGDDPLWNSVINPDQWDGYNAEREAIFAFVGSTPAETTPTIPPAIENFVVLTGDIHTSWAINLVDDPRKRTPSFTPVSPPVPPTFSYGVEFVTPSITSPGLPDPGGSLSTSLETNNQHIKWVDLENRGYSILDITPAEIACTWYHVNSITDVEDETQTAARGFKVNDGDNFLTEVF